MRVRPGLLASVAVSLVAHALLIAFVPPPSTPEAVAPQALHVVELRRVEVPLPELPPLRPRPVEPADIGRPLLRPSAERPGPPPAARSPKEVALSPRLPEVKEPLPSPSITLPDLKPTKPTLPPERTGAELAPPGTPRETEGDSKLKVPPSVVGPVASLPDRLRNLRELFIQKELQKAPKERRTNLEIRGPAAARELVFRPPPPEAPGGAEGEIELKFWVLPDGTVGRVVLLRRGNLELETVAIQNLKRWKFNALPPDAEVPEQWGTLRFRFLSAAAKRLVPPRPKAPRPVVRPPGPPPSGPEGDPRPGAASRPPAP